MIGTTTSRACVFIDSSNPSLPSQLINSSTPLIRPPFPPLINPHDLVSPNPSSKNDFNRKKIPTRAPNAFIIYRKIFIETARSQGYYLPMTVISSMASQSWEQESDVVKSEYKRLAREAFNIRCELLPKSFGSSRRKKREKWNIISFDSKSGSSDGNGNDGNVSNGHLYSNKKELPGLLNWNSRSNIDHVSYPSCVFSSSTLSSPEINNDSSFKESYDPVYELPPLLSSNNKKNNTEYTKYSPPKIKTTSSKILLLLNPEDE